MKNIFIWSVNMLRMEIFIMQSKKKENITIILI